MVGRVLMRAMIARFKKAAGSISEVVFPAVLLALLGGIVAVFVFSGKSYAVGFIETTPSVVALKDEVAAAAKDRIRRDVEMSEVRAVLKAAGELSQSNFQQTVENSRQIAETGRQIVALSEQIKALAAQEALDRINSREADARIEGRLNTLISRP